MSLDHQQVRIIAVEEDAGTAREDQLAVEAPLAIHVGNVPPLITLRTPGHDLELTAGLLLGEGLVRGPEDLLDLRVVAGREDAVQVRLRGVDRPTEKLWQRSGAMTSACGACGRSTLYDEPPHAPGDAGPRLHVRQLAELPRQLHAAQGVFQHTGGLHAAALFDRNAELIAVREDVGRHNALDKLLGWAMLQGRLPLHDHGVLLSGRASYELLQKSITAGIALVCALSAPSTYAVRLAREHDVTLIGFLRGQRFNIYSAPRRIVGIREVEAPPPAARASSGAPAQRP